MGRAPNIQQPLERKNAAVIELCTRTTRAQEIADKLVDALKHSYSLAELFAELDLARSSYFYHRARLRLPDKYADARVAIADVFQSNHRCYGYRRMRAALGRRQLHISAKVVQRLMKQECLVVAANKKSVGTGLTLAKSAQHPRTSSTGTSRRRLPMRSG